ncbi:vacuolar membrane-associated protein iml1 [Recurvomyces mirabilis]|nr:vacuolar membrane-associated protein iml1 [Recurvomyces mirabilis]
MAIDQLKRACTVVLHDDSISTDDVLSGSKVVPTGMLARLQASGARPLFFIAVAVARNPDEISVHTNLAQRFGIENRSAGTVEVLEDESEATATHVELFFRDQNLSRADMWQISHRLNHTVVYQGQKIQYLGSTVADIRQVYISGKEVLSAYAVRGKTRPIYRSGSARYTILIQISKEMLEYWLDGDLMWEELKVRHQVSVVLFGRSLDQHEKDFYHVIASDLSSSNWRDLCRSLKRAFNGNAIPRDVTLAARGSMVEAIHMSAMDFANDNIDPHLSGRGTSIIAITASTGLFRTTHGLLKSTTHLLMGNSIGVDIVALSPKPLHPVPLFSYQRDGQWEYALPHWVDISFWQGQRSVHAATFFMPETVGEVDEIALPLLIDSAKGESSQMTRFMDIYDAGVFGDQSTSMQLVVTQTAQLHADKKLSQPPSVVDQTSALPNPLLNTPVLGKAPISSIDTLKARARDLPSRASSTNTKDPFSLLASNRKISLGPKGLAPSRGLATTTLSVEPAQQAREEAGSTPFSPDEGPSGIARQIRQSLARKSSQQSLVSVPAYAPAELSRPIDIMHGHPTISEAPSDPASLIERKVLGTVSGSGFGNSAADSFGTPTAKKDVFYAAVKAAEQEGNWNTSPWLTLLNPCNPTRENMRVAAQYRKWQHVFPRAISSADFKWTSMCTPAALPLSTEYKPSKRELERHFSKKVRRLLAPTRNGWPDTGSGHTEVQLIKLRLAHGFQLASLTSSAYSPANDFDRILMSRGNVHHEFQRLSDAELQIVEYELSLDDEDAASDVAEYSTRVRSAASDKVRNVVTSLSSERREPNWSQLDDQVIAHDPLHTELHSSRMRLVLIPVEPPRQGHITPGPARGLSDEERRIDGIQKLTQLWQRNRYFKPEELRQQASFVRPRATPVVSARDPNPLAIEYQTRDPSAVVNAYGPTLTKQLDGAEPAGPLFAESEMYHSSNFDTAKLVKQLQEPPPHGVEVRDRRWLTRLHFNCFRGDEMVNWLLRVFKDLTTRDDAIEIGNQLMGRGIFSHVRARHEFRDGNYFYQISSSHRTNEYPDNASMFGRVSLRSLPATPMVEHNHSPLLKPIYEDAASSSGKPTPTLAAVDKKEILLSQQMLYNVDAGKKSDQLEIVSLHYDRIHNPENCYHIQLEWVNTTTVLIRDSINRWTALAEGYGLKLVQVPLTEASKMHLQHPLDQCIEVVLAVRPPDKSFATPLLDARMMSPRLRMPVEDPIPYQKALLRKLDFVLDLEAASSFSAELNVRYSWGAPEYVYTQFVHKSGLLLAQLLGPHYESAISDSKDWDILLLPNRLASASSRSMTVSSRHAESSESTEQLVKRIVAFCEDESRLMAFYEEVMMAKVAPPPSPWTAMDSLAGNLDGDIPPMLLPPRLGHRSMLKNIG